jgi:hypothetical protein
VRAKVRELAGVRCRVVDRAWLTGSKAAPRTDPHEAARDRADLEALREDAAGGR